MKAPGRKVRLAMIAGGVALAMLAGAWMGRAAALEGFARWLDVGETPAPADLIMILPGDSNTRPFVAAALWKRGYAPEIVMSREAPALASREESHGHGDVVMREVLRARGVPDRAMRVLPGESLSTFDDARALAGELRARPGMRVIVVTSGFHTRRARWVLRRALGRSAASIRMVSAPTDGFGPADWWRREEGIATYLSEYLKFVFYVYRYGDAGAWTAAGALAVGAAGFAARRRRRGRGGKSAPTTEPTAPA